jgi:hypothetical protein
MNKNARISGLVNNAASGKVDSNTMAIGTNVTADTITSDATMAAIVAKG